MDVSGSAQTSNDNGSNIPIDCCLYKAAISSHTDENVDSSKLQENLSRVTAGGENTVLHLASAAGNLPFIQQLLRFNLQPWFIEKINAKGNTALHEAAQIGHYEVVEFLLHHTTLVDRPNTHNHQTPLFQACEGGHSGIVKKLLEANPSKLFQKSSDGRTCLHVVVSRGDADLLNYFLTYDEKNCESETRDWESKRTDLLKEMDGHGNTVLHLAVKRNRLDMVKRLAKFEPGLSYSLNLEKETAICVAVKLGFLSIVEALVYYSPDSIEIASRNGKNILHLAVELSQVKILQWLVESKVDLSQLINQKMGLPQLINECDETPRKDDIRAQKDRNQSRGDTPLHIAANNTNVYMDLSLRINKHDESGGDTPLHIATKNKNVYMVGLLLKVPGLNRDAVNNAGLTPLDIAKENTDYYEPYKIIEKLSVYPERHRPFLYSVPTISLLKKKKAAEIVDKIFVDRGTAELVVAVLLATMAFQAVFTVPGSFHSDTEDKEMLGVPVMIGYDSFKLFLIFDCLAFFLSLFVVLMWEMSTLLTTTDKMLFMYMTNAAVCTAFAFTAFGLMAALYLVLAHKVKKFAWIVLGSCMFIALCGTVVFIYIVAKFMVRRARFHRLCGVPRLLDDMVESVWVMAETYGVLDFARTCDEFCHALISGGEKNPPSCPHSHDPENGIAV